MRAVGRGGEGHIGFDKWTVKVPIWPSMAFSSCSFIHFCPLLPPLFSSGWVLKSGQTCSERLTECKPGSPLWRRKEVADRLRCL